MEDYCKLLKKALEIACKYIDSFEFCHAVTQPCPTNISCQKCIYNKLMRLAAKELDNGE